eukprot:s1727_g9.t1
MTAKGSDGPMQEDPFSSWPPWFERRHDARGNHAASRPFGAAFDGEPQAWRQMLTALGEVGRKYGKTPSQVAINWVLCQGAVAIPGARSATQAAENAGAMGWRLHAEDTAYLASLGARGQTSDFQHG